MPQNKEERTMAINRMQQLDIIAYMTATSGSERRYFGPDGEVSRTCKVLTVPVAIVCSDDTCTEVELFEDGTMEINGWDGTEGLGDVVEKYSDEEISTLFDAMCCMV